MTDDNKISKFFNENKELITMLVGLISTIVVSGYNTYLYFHSQSLEDFYGIPSYYFYDDSEMSYFIRFVFIMAALIIIFLPTEVLKSIIGTKKLNRYDSFAFWLMRFTLIFELLNILIIVSFNIISIKILLLIGVIAFVFNINYYRDLTNEKKYDPSYVEHGEAGNSKGKVFNVVLFVLLIFIILFPFVNLFIERPSKMKDYEITKIESAKKKSIYNDEVILEDYKDLKFVIDYDINIMKSTYKVEVIVGHYKDLPIVVEGEIDCKDKDNLNLTITKYKYRIGNNKDMKLHYIHFNSVEPKEDGKY